MPVRSTLAVLAGLILAASGSVPALARPGGWGGWDGAAWGGPDRDASRSTAGRREGRIEVNRFVAGDDAARALGHGRIAVAADTRGQDYVPQGDRAAFEAAVIDQLVRAGYDTAHADADDGQLAELTVTRTTVEAAGERRRPVSGEMGMSIGNRGTAYGLGLNIDLSKPRPPLVATRLEARIRDRATGQTLWEGRAEVAVREGSKGWTEQDIAARLAEALFRGFPGTSGETIQVR
ncbi:MAG: hypothetical protein LBV50_06435 [Novosphingobium sp.]|jgi:hypothetical protein|nr:hypothetical protein [Novosphingobium sp.]